MIFGLKINLKEFKNIFSRHSFFLCVLLYILAIPEVSAQSQENLNAILDRMGRLENDIRNLNLSISRGITRPDSSQVVTQGSNSLTNERSSQQALSGSKVAGSISSHAMARLSVQMADLENDLRSVTGSMEKFNFQIGKLASRMDKLVADVDYRLGLLERQLLGDKSTLSTAPTINPAPLPPSVQKIIPDNERSFASEPGSLGMISKSRVQALKSNKIAENPPQSVLSDSVRTDRTPSERAKKDNDKNMTTAVAENSSSILPKGNAKQQYDYAFGLLRQAKYEKAEIALQEFVNSNPKDKLAVNARYWLGETFYVRRAYVQAAEVFFEGYQADPKGKKAIDSLLKLGMSLSGLEKKREACSTFEKIIKDFPNASTAMLKTISREKKKNSCS